MRVLLALAAAAAAAAAAASAEEVQVRLYTAHPPPALTIVATAGELRWSSCPSCPEHSERTLLLRAREAGPADMGPAPPEAYFVTGSYELRAEGAPALAGNFPLRVEDTGEGFLVVASMPVEEYLERVLGAESGSFRDAEALKAMAVAARSYSERFRRQHAREGFDFCDTTHCQVVSWRPPGPAVHAAAEATRGQLLFHRESVAAAYYHQDCGGTVAAASETWAQDPEPYLAVHADPFCRVHGGLTWQTSLARSQIDRALEASGLRAPDGWTTLEVVSRSRSGRARTVRLSGGGRAFAVSASSLRFSVNRAFGWNQLRSDLYEVRNTGETVLFSGRGAGHGVGLCQAGAEEMARQGKGYREILAFYYPGTQLTGGPAAPQKISDARFDLVSPTPGADAELLPLAERLLHEGEERVGWRLPYRPTLEVYATVASYRDATGQPGWVAASTRGRRVRLQPLAELRKRAILESTLRHELYHLLVEWKAAGSVPRWFREGLVLELSGAPAPDAAPALPAEEIERRLVRGGSREELERAYAAAEAIVAALVREKGRPQVLAWLSGGLPDAVLRRVSGRAGEAPGH